MQKDINYIINEGRYNTIMLRKYAKFNGEFGFDESVMPQPPNVTETYDIEDDECEDIACDPYVDYECDGDMLDNFDGWYYDESSFDVFKLKELITECAKNFEKVKFTYTGMSESLSEDLKEYCDTLIECIQTDILEMENYIQNPMLYSDNIDMIVMINWLSKSGTIPLLYQLEKELKENQNN